MSIKYIKKSKRNQYSYFSICSICGKLRFHDHKRDVLTHRGKIRKYCSRSCANKGPEKIASLRGRQFSKSHKENLSKSLRGRLCPIKGKRMKDLNPNYINPMKGKKRPDLAEFNKSKRYTQLGKNNPGYVHGKQAGYSFSHKLHYKMSCFVCGTFEDVHTHHMDDDHTNNVYSNFEWLCRACHSRYHRLKENHSISTINGE